MRAGNKFWWFASIAISLIAAILLSLAVLFWRQLSPESHSLLIQIFRNQFPYIFSAGFLVIAGLGFALDGIFHIYILPVMRLKEEIALIHSVNPSHRIQTEGTGDILAIIRSINEAADRAEALQRDIQEKIDAARADAEAEKNILAAFMAELPEGVVICNADGQILLYNKQAKHYLTSDRENGPESESQRSPSGRFIGLGRSIFTLIDRNLILHALDEIAEKLSREEATAASSFVLINENELFLRAEAVPVLDDHRRLTGFLLLLFDITRQLESDSRINLLIQSVTQKSRASLASIRSAIEAILEYPDMAREQLRRFREIIHKEVMDLGALVDRSTEEFPGYARNRWPLVRTEAGELLDTVRRKARERLEITLTPIHCDLDTPIKVDTYSLVLTLLFVLDQLSRETGRRAFDCELLRRDRLLNFNFLWEGPPVKLETLRRWDSQLLSVRSEKFPLTFKTVIEHHEAEVWSYSSRRLKEKSYLRLLLPVVESIEPDKVRNLTILPQSRPAFYDFDLFHQPGQLPELDECLLSELAYTVFDTETTGLNPAAGDEIISIGAVRIVNGRLLRTELYDQLVDPRRPIPAESVKIHGIRPEMLQGQPTIAEVLPAFHQFAEGTILVAHNAAFDMRMLQLQETSSGVRFINPVLDTMLLSEVVHPAQKSHNLEDIAQRLGVSIVGRHTAAGDALATGEVFLKLLSLLARSGIHTMKQARTASEKTYNAKIKY